MWNLIQCFRGALNIAFGLKPTLGIHLNIYNFKPTVFYVVSESEDPFFFRAFLTLVALAEFKSTAIACNIDRNKEDKFVLFSIGHGYQYALLTDYTNL